MARARPSFLIVWIAAAIGCDLAHAQGAPPPDPVRSASAVIADGYGALSEAAVRQPINLELGLRFAEQAVARGDYPAAIDVLERMLAVNSNLPRVKLELGVLYYKLGSYEQAKARFEDALKGDVPPEVRARVALYLAEIARRLSPYAYSLFLQSGARYQTNASIGPDSNLVHSLGQNAILSNRFARAPDWNWFAIAALNFGYKFDRRGDAIELSLLGYDAQQARLHAFDLALLEAIIGPRLVITPNVSIKPYAIGDLVWAGDRRYFDGLGGGGSFRSRVTSNLLVEAYAETRHRTFYDSVNYPSASQQTGNISTAALSTDLGYGLVHLTTRWSYDLNRAIVAFQSYDRWSVDVGLPLVFSVPIADAKHQLVVTPTGGYSYTPFRAPDPSVDPFVTRRDRETRVGGIVDFQLYQNFGIRTQVTQTWISSTLPNYATKNFAVAFGPTARF